MIKRSRLALASVCTALLAFPLRTKAEGHPLVGINYPPLPEGVESISSWVTGGSYTVRQVLVNKQKLLLLNRLSKRDQQGKGFYEVINVLALPPITETEEILAGTSCTVNGKEDRDFIMIMKSNDNTPHLTKARKA